MAESGWAGGETLIDSQGLRAVVQWTKTAEVGKKKKRKEMEKERLQEEPPANQGSTWWQNVVLLDEICRTGTHITTK
jgi:hypothetical protein